VGHKTPKVYICIVSKKITSTASTATLIQFLVNVPVNQAAPDCAQGTLY